MALHHPVRLAVQLAVLHNLSHGRLEVGIGRGSIYNEYEYVGFGLRSDDRRERMEEAVEVVPLLGQDNILWGSDHPHPDGVWPDSRSVIERDLGGLPPGVRRKDPG